MGPGCLEGVRTRMQSTSQHLLNSPGTRPGRSDELARTPSFIYAFSDQGPLAEAEKSAPSPPRTARNRRRPTRRWTPRSPAGAPSATRAIQTGRMMQPATGARGLSNIASMERRNGTADPIFITSSAIPRRPTCALRGDPPYAATSSSIFGRLIDRATDEVEKR